MRVAPPPGAVDEPYLARREPDGSWVEVPLALPGVHERVASAAATPSGELWIVTGTRNYASEAPCPCLWRRSPDADDPDAWEPVALGSIEPFPDDEPRWAHVLTEQSWIEVPAAVAPRLYPAARELVWADDALWVTAELGRAYPGAAEPVFADPRMILYSSVPLPAGAAPTELPATDRLYDERWDRLVRETDPGLVPGSDACQTFTVVLVDDADGAGREVAAGVLEQLPAIRAASTLEAEDRWASASMLYLGRHLDEPEGTVQLVLEANAWSPRSATGLADALALALGRRPSLDCRPRAMVSAVERLR